MNTLVFDPQKSFSDNLAAFRNHLETVDPDFTRILFDHLEILQGNDPQAVAKFNRRVLDELAQLAQEEEE